MKRILTILVYTLSCVMGYSQTSFNSKGEAMEYARNTHNGAILRIQKYANSHNTEDIISAVVLSGRAVSIAQNCVTQLSDLSYGPDAVKIVKANNYVMAYFLHEIFHSLIDKEDAKKIDSKEIFNQYVSNLKWMTQMYIWDEEKIKWLWGDITKQDIAGVFAVIQFIDDDPSFKETDEKAGEHSILKMIGRYYFDYNCFKTEQKWNLFYTN